MGDVVFRSVFGFLLCFAVFFENEPGSGANEACVLGQ
jgi:hypothetical protein